MINAIMLYEYICWFDELVGIYNGYNKSCGKSGNNGGALGTYSYNALGGKLINVIITEIGNNWIDSIFVLVNDQLLVL
jgi:hypothetical protein